MSGLVIGLQNRAQRFESATDLNKMIAVGRKARGYLRSLGEDVVPPPYLRYFIRQLSR